MSVTAYKDKEVLRTIKISGVTTTTIAINIYSVGSSGDLTELIGSPFNMNKVEDGIYLFKHTFDTLGTYSIKHSTIMTDSVVVIDELSKKIDTDDILSSLSHLSHVIYIDTDAITQGTGTFNSPFNTVESCLDYVEANNVHKVVLRSDIVLDREMHDITFYGQGYHTLDSADGIRDFEGCEVYNAILTGYMDKILAINCTLNGANLWGTYINCGVDGEQTCSSSKRVIMEGCYDVSTNTDVPYTAIALNSVQDNFKLNITGYEGSVMLSDSGNPLNRIVINLKGGRLAISNSCEEGVCNLYGGYALINNSTGNFVLEEEFTAASSDDVQDSTTELDSTLQSINLRVSNMPLG